MGVLFRDPLSYGDWPITFCEISTNLWLADVPMVMAISTINTMFVELDIICREMERPIPPLLWLWPSIYKKLGFR